MFCLLQSHMSHERQMLCYSWISFHSQYHAPLSATSSVWSDSDCRSTLPVQLDWAWTSQSIHIINVKWWFLEHGIPHDLPDWKFWLFCCIANLLEDGCLPHIGMANDKDMKTPGKPSNIFCLSPLSFYILCSLKFSIGKRHLSPGCLRWWKWWRIKISTVGSMVLFGWSATGMTSLTHFHSAHSSSELVQLFVNFIPLTQMEFPIYKHVIDSSTELFKPQSAHNIHESMQVCSQIWPPTKQQGREWIQTPG